MKKCGAIILAAGKGTRMKSERAKVTFSLAGKALLQRVVNTALEIDCNLIGVVVGFKKEDTIACVKPDSKIVFVEQPEQKGTGHAVMMGEQLFNDFDGDILILCGDVPLLKSETLRKLLIVHREKNASCTVLTVNMADPGSYGRIVRNGSGGVERIVEYKDANESEKNIKEINSGIYCFNSKDLFSALTFINTNNQQGEYYLTDTLGVLKKLSKEVTALMTDDIIEVSGVNSQQQLSELETMLYDNIKKHWLNNGVTIENPNTVIIGEEVTIAADTHISSNTILKGKTSIGTFSHIGPGCYLENATIEDNVTLKGFNVIINTKVNAETIIKWGDKIL